jgi:hypothetical protein
MEETFRIEDGMETRSRDLFLLWLGVITLMALPISTPAEEPSYKVYSVYSGVFMGNPGETPRKDFFVNMGSKHGVKAGTQLQVLRKAPTYDLLSKKLYRDMTYPIGVLKVIYSEEDASIARLEKMLPDDQTPALSPRAVMVGDLVQLQK